MRKRKTTIDEEARRRKKKREKKKQTKPHLPLPRNVVERRKEKPERSDD